MERSGTFESHLHLRPGDAVPVPGEITPVQSLAVLHTAPQAVQVAVVTVFIPPRAVIELSTVP